VRTDYPDPRSLNTTARRRLRDEQARRWYSLNDRIATLLGPTSGQSDPLLASRAARDAAAAHLEKASKYRNDRDRSQAGASVCATRHHAAAPRDEQARRCP
jgi:hypothetical protein